MRNIQDPPAFLLAVDPSGRVRTLTYGINGTSSKLRSSPIVNGKRLVGRKDIALTDTARENGWRHLEELYEKEIADEEMDAEAAAARMRDYQQVVLWYQAANARKGGKFETPYPADYLPDALQGTYQNPSNNAGVNLAPPSKPRKKPARKTGAKTEAADK